MHKIVAEVSFKGMVNYQIIIKVIDVETGNVISERPYCSKKDQVLECETYYRATLAQEVIQKALDISMEVYNSTQNIELAVVEFDYNTVYSPVINYPTSHIVYA